MYEQERAELGKIDYFLDQLARAVERGEVHRTSYDTLAPRYLARREQLVRILVPRPAGPVSAAAQPPSAAQPLPLSAAQGQPMRPPAYTPPSAATARKPFTWTTALIVLGAFLVITAGGIFVLATWELMPPPFRLFFLALATAGFYAAGAIVRRKLQHSVGGAALLAVASALLLFDGWLLIDVASLSGPWPWVAWLAVCSAAYWFTETRVAGGFFGVIGAAAQVAWWWLLGEGLGWDLAPRLAGIAVVAAAWTLAAHRGREVRSLADLARVLRWAGPILMVLVLAAAVPGIVASDSGVFSITISVLVIAWAGTATAEGAQLPRPVGVVAHLLLLLVAGVLALGGDDVSSGLLLLGAAVLAVAYEALRGGVAHGLTAAPLAAIGVGTIAGSLHISPDWSLALSGVVATAFAVVGSSLRPVARSGGTQVHGKSLGQALALGGLVALGFASLGILPTVEAIPLTGSGISVRDLVLVAAFFGLWAITTVVGRLPAAVPGTIIASVALLAFGLDASNVPWPAALIAVAFLGLALVWLILRVLLEKLTGLPAWATAAGARFLTLAVLVVGIFAEAVRGDFPHYSGAILLLAAAAWWLADRVLLREEWSIVPAAFLAVVAAAYLGAWKADAALASTLAAFAALAGVAMCHLLRQIKGVGNLGIWAFIASGIALLPLAFGDALSLSFASLACALALALAAISNRVWSLLAGAVALATLSAGGALVHLDVSPWFTVMGFAVIAWAALGPGWLFRPGVAHPARPALHAFATGGLVPVSAILTLGMLSMTGSVSGWMDVYGHPLAAGLILCAGWVLAASVVYRVEQAVYAGVGLALLALFVALDTLDARWVELYSTPAALYVAWSGYFWASRKAGRVVPLITDVAAAIIALAVPFFAMVKPGIPLLDSWTHTIAVFGLALGAIILGIVLRVRPYFFAGIAAVALTALVRTWDALVLMWWLILGVVGVAMIVVALAREVREAMASGVRGLLDGWR